MTAAATDPPEDVLHFDRTDEQKAAAAPAARERLPFTLDDDDTILWALKPKTAILLNLGATAALALATDDQMTILRLYDLFMDTVLDPPSAAYLRAKFLDEDDSWDIEMLDPVMEALLARWYQRPTVGQSGSAGLPRTTGRRSTARKRSQGATP